MESDDEQHNKEQPTANIPEKQATSSMFSQEEINAIVRDFVLAWIRGDVKIKFPTSYEILEGAKQEGHLINKGLAHEVEAKGKTDLVDLIKTCGKPATSEQLQEVTDKLFARILLLRCGNRIEGSFAEYSLESKIEKIEEQIATMTVVIQELVFWAKTGVKPSGMS